jgi:dihydrofolate reductase
MIISLLVAMDQRGGIGFQGQLPWRLPDELKNFKKLTWGHHLLMGRKTFTSIGRVLPGRVSMVLTHQPDQIVFPCQPPDCLIFTSLNAALEAARLAGEEELFIIGGGELFNQTLPLCDRIYLTQVQATVPADVLFPPFSFDEWEILSSLHHPADTNHLYPFTIMTLQRR